MMQSLLWSAFALFTIIAIVALFQAVQLASAKRSASNTMVAISDHLAFMTNQRVDNGMENNVPNVLESGIISPDLVTTEEGEPAIALPFGGKVIHITRSSPSMSMDTGGDGLVSIVFSEPSAQSERLCNYLATGYDADRIYEVNRLIDGPLGSQYNVYYKSCDADMGALIIGVGYRGGTGGLAG